MSVTKSERLRRVKEARQAVAAGFSVIVASAIGVITALVTARPSSGLWAALAVLVLIGVVLQIIVSREEPSREEPIKRVEARGPAAIAIGGSTRGSVRSRFRGKFVAEKLSSNDSDVSAS